MPVNHLQVLKVLRITRHVDTLPNFDIVSVLKVNLWLSCICHLSRRKLVTDSKTTESIIMCNLSNSLSFKKKSQLIFHAGPIFSHVFRPNQRCSTNSAVKRVPDSSQGQEGKAARYNPDHITLEFVYMLSRRKYNSFMFSLCHCGHTEKYYSQEMPDLGII